MSQLNQNVEPRTELPIECVYIINTLTLAPYGTKETDLRLAVAIKRPTDILTGWSSGCISGREPDRDSEVSSNIFGV